MKTKDWESIGIPRVLVIGHDPRLQESETIAPFALFADYYFKQESTNPSERSKYGLTKATFDQIVDITNGKIGSESIYITNLCNYPLPQAGYKREENYNDASILIGLKIIFKIGKTIV